MVSASVIRRDDGKTEIVTKLSIFGLAGQPNAASKDGSCPTPKRERKERNSTISNGPQVVKISFGEQHKQDLESMAKDLNPIVGFWDPLSLTSASYWGRTEEATIGWLRQSEIKHGRVTMAAFVGEDCITASRWAGRCEQTRR